MADGNLRRIFSEHIKSCAWTPIESGLTERGIPDAHFCINGSCGWIEYKQSKFWRVGMRPEQIGWMEKQLRNGGRVFIAVRRSENELWLLTGWAARVAKVDGLRGVPKRTLIGVWEGQPADWPWRKIAKCLATHKFLTVAK